MSLYSTRRRSSCIGFHVNMMKMNFQRSCLPLDGTTTQFGKYYTQVKSTLIVMVVCECESIISYLPPRSFNKKVRSRLRKILPLDAVAARGRHIAGKVRSKSISVMF